MAEGEHRNRLADEKSPYLLQHAGNPVDWYPWGDEAFERAAAEDRPVLLSIGYSTCHWCHVMAHESFEDPEIAALLNESFVNIKVDREERPDIDSVYMTVSQMMTGSGGWPLTIVMTPDRRPFFAATYIPKDDRFGRVGLRRLVPMLREAWDDRRDEVLSSAGEIVAHLAEQSTARGGRELDEGVLETAYVQFAQRFDGEHGGFGAAPKFPSPHNILFLLRYWRRTGDEWALRMATRTLEAMRMGGVYDHVGFGFHRYSTDARWLLPHFEKMLYDQAMLLMAYTEAAQATGEEAFASTATEIAEYVLRDMTSPEGAFHSAEDADSEGEEGRFYVWTVDELKEVLGEEDAAFAAGALNVRRRGNFKEEATGQATGANVLHLTSPVEDSERLESVRRRLFEARGERVRPHLDDKVLTDWNGLMVAALARAGSALERHELVEAAERAMAFVLGRMVEDDDRLLHRYRDGEAAIDGQLDDHAFVVWGLLELYEATFEPEYLERALALNASMLEHFWDADGGGLFLTADDGEELLVRQKAAYDGALPSGSSAAMSNLLRLSHMTADPELERRASELADAFSGDIARMPVGHAQFLQGLDLALGGAREVVVVGDPTDDATEEMLSALRRSYSPHKVVLFKPTGPGGAALEAAAPFVKDHQARDGRPTAYVCEDHFCNRPTTDVDAMLEELGVHKA